MKDSLLHHWPEYLMEAAELGIFMLSACLFGVLLEHSGSPVKMAIPDPFARRALMGIAMGVTAIAIVYSPWGKQSGAHFNPAMTYAFFKLGKIEKWDAAFYILSQFAGGISGVLIATLFVGESLANSSVNYVVTLPGGCGVAMAFVGEFLIAFILMYVVLIVSNTERIARYTGFFAGTLVALYITLEAPLSGMSMNPARTFGSALPAMRWDAIWIYFVAPSLAMVAASAAYIRHKGMHAVACVKLHHQNNKRCIHCGKNMH